MKTWSWVFFMLAASLSGEGQTFRLQQYVDDIRAKGEEPVQFVSKALNTHNLIVFDDALHTAWEPFVFYNQLINSEALRGKLQYIFLEVISTTAQPAIDSFLHATVKDSTILLKAFQDDYSGNGLTLQTYLDLFSTVWEHNRQVPDSLKIKLTGVNPPIYWEAIHTWEDYSLFQQSGKARDYFMYLEILQHLDRFKRGKKGLFLTNTRHAYKNIKNAAGEYYWNTNTFLAQWHPGKTCSIRLHNVTLQIEAAKNTGERKSTDGLQEMVYKWVKMDGGRWDSAFAACGNKPVAVPLVNTVFGRSGYIGNHMRNVLPGTTMYDAYDALIFLAPLTGLHFSAQSGFIYTPAFRGEFKRRLQLLKGNKFETFLLNHKARSFDEYYETQMQFKPVSKNDFLKE